MCSSAKRTDLKPIRTSGYVFLFLSAISTNLKKYCPDLHLLRLRFECSEQQLCLHIIQKAASTMQGC